MAIATKLATSAVIVVSAIAVWFYVGQDPQAFLSFVDENKSELALAVQIGAMFILGITKHYIAGGILLVTSIATLFGVVL